ncbi:MAG: hypothetical protein WKF83_16910 [Nocardioidaceae bacterium]
MRSLPLADPGIADSRSPGRYLFWVARGQLATVLGGAAFGIIGFVAQALMPAIIGEAIDEGVAASDTGALTVLGWRPAHGGHRPGRRRGGEAPLGRRQLADPRPFAPSSW